MKNILLTIEYDGSGFHGWQEQRGLRTVQGTLQDALQQVLGEQIKVNGTSRTDAGVHALGQCCNFTGDFSIPTKNLIKAANNILSEGKTSFGAKPGDIRIIDAREVPEDFHARFNCKGKTYMYVINTEAPDIFRRNYCYYVDPKGVLPDFAAMELAAAHIVGTHDFACFQASGGTPRETTVRTVQNLEIIRRATPEDHIRRAPFGLSGGDYASDFNADDTSWRSGDIVISVTGDGFLYNMVRIIAGTLIEVGLGKRTAASVRDAIVSKERSLAGHTAPAEGLYLAKIYFDGSRF